VGQLPYQTRLNLRIPRIVEALPGAKLDLRVNPSYPEDIEILGPAGACDWLNEAAAVPGQTWGPTSVVIPDADASMAPFRASANDDSDAATVRAIQRGGAPPVGCIVFIAVVLTLAVTWCLSASH
jgi:flagellin-like protein